MKAVLLTILIGVAVSLAGDGTCKKFTIWNPNTNDTLYHFFRGKGQVGDCWYDYHMIGHRVEWHCQKMAMVHKSGTKVIKSDTSVIKDTRGEISLNPFTYYCESVW